MEAQTKLRSLLALLVLVAIIIVNTTMVLLNIFSPTVALALYAFTAISLFGALRYQRQLSRAATVILLAVPLVLVSGMALLMA